MRIGPIAPSPRIALAMVYDHWRRRAIMFGGLINNTRPPTNELWEYNEIQQATMPPTWTRVQISANWPSGRFDEAMALDDARDRVIMSGGIGTSTPTADLWEYDGSAAQWSQVPTVSNTPGPRAGHTIYYDPTRLRAVLWGG